MNQRQDKIHSLTAEWCNLVASDHHKDRDMHFHIDIKYSYGSVPVYVVSHEGYIEGRFSATFSTLEEAEEYLIKRLSIMVDIAKIAQEEENGNS